MLPLDALTIFVSLRGQDFQKQTDVHALLALSETHKSLMVARFASQPYVPRTR